MSLLSFPNHDATPSLTEGRNNPHGSHGTEDSSGLKTLDLPRHVPTKLPALGQSMTPQSPLKTSLDTQELSQPVSLIGDMDSKSTAYSALKVNLHITEKCNFGCLGCFAHFNQGAQAHLSVPEWEQVIDNLANSGCVHAINFAGGEPLLYKGLAHLINYAAFRGFATSLITNGSLLSLDFLDEVAGSLSTIGISIDSFNVDTMRQLQRCDRKQNCFDLSQLKRWLPYFRERHMTLKINTVVSKLNWQEKISAVFMGDAELQQQVKRWKVLRIKEFEYTNHKEQDNILSNAHLLISDEQFAYFCHNNPFKNRVIESSMVNSYFIIDNLARLLNNKDIRGYSPIGGSLVSTDFREVLKLYHDFDHKLYEQRYEIEFAAS